MAQVRRSLPEGHVCHCGPTAAAATRGWISSFFFLFCASFAKPVRSTGGRFLWKKRTLFLFAGERNKARDTTSAAGKCSAQTMLPIPCTAAPTPRACGPTAPSPRPPLPEFAPNSRARTAPTPGGAVLLRVNRCREMSKCLQRG